MEEILEGLNQTQGIQGCLIVGRDGLVIAQSGETSNIDSDTLGVSTSEFFATAESMMGDRLEQGPVDMLLVESDRTKMVLSGITDEAFLLVLARPRVNLGLVRWEIKAASEKLKDVL